MDGALPFLILILVLGASVGFAIGISAIVSRWERTVPKPGMSAFMDISKTLAPGLVPSKVYVLDSTSTTRLGMLAAAPSSSLNPGASYRPFYTAKASTKPA